MADMPLNGLKVIDLSHHMAGPFASQRLGDMGADIIKIEPLGYGEWTRIRPIGNGWVSEYVFYQYESEQAKPDIGSEERKRKEYFHGDDQNCRYLCQQFSP